MCGIAGIFNLKKVAHAEIHRHLEVMDELLQHRGPDDYGYWVHKQHFIGFVHRRLQIIDLISGRQPMEDVFGNVIIFNGELYNYLELKQNLEHGYPFKTTSDTEVVLAAYQKWGKDCVNHFRGMFAFAIWDSKNQRLFCARDRFGIKPFYFTFVGHTLFFASEPKALIPFLSEIKTDEKALQDYLVFQFCLGTKTLFKDIKELPPAYTFIVENGEHHFSKYWEVFYDLDFDHTPKFFEEKLRHLIHESVKIHTRSDVPIGAYVSGGIDSSIIAAVASTCQKNEHKEFLGFNGRFSEGAPGEFDESQYAHALSQAHQFELHVADITSQDFINTFEKVIYHLDFPVAGPGSFPQYHVSKLAATHRKVVLGGQGGDEIFGGYTRYLIAYFEQCIKAAINGTSNSGNFIVTYQSIIPNLTSLKNYQPLLQEFWRDGLFESLDKRYYRLINRAPTLQNEIRWETLTDYSPLESFLDIFHGKNVGKESYFDSMTHFDFKTLLRALLHVEDRMSMAHGLESRVPFLDHPLVEFAATIPSNIKFKDGTLKMILVNAMEDVLPQEILNRKDKMGFPVPLNIWLKSDIKEFVHDIFTSQKAKERPYFNHTEIVKSIASESKFGRKVWGLLSLEMWHRQFHDQHQKFRKMLSNTPKKNLNQVHKPEYSNL